MRYLRRRSVLYLVIALLVLAALLGPEFVYRDYMPRAPIPF